MGPHGEKVYFQNTTPTVVILFSQTSFKRSFSVKVLLKLKLKIKIFWKEKAKTKRCLGMWWIASCYLSTKCGNNSFGGYREEKFMDVQTENTGLNVFQAVSFVLFMQSVRFRDLIFIKCILWRVIDRVHELWNGGNTGVSPPRQWWNHTTICPWRRSIILFLYT